MIKSFKIIKALHFLDDNIRLIGNNGKIKSKNNYVKKSIQTSLPKATAMIIVDAMTVQSLFGALRC